VSGGTIRSAEDRARDAEPTFVRTVSIVFRKPAMRGFSEPGPGRASDGIPDRQERSYT
jgi:hypothetical protein